MSVMSVFEIQTMHRSRTAVLNQEYTCIDGHKYIGTEQKRLRLAPVASETIFKPTTTILSTTAQQAIETSNANTKTLQRLTLLNGVIDGANTSFTYEQAPMMVYYNGQLLNEGDGYARTFNTINLITVPAIGDILSVYGNK